MATPIASPTAASVTDPNDAMKGRMAMTTNAN
jgi:hypothetical protein